MSNREHNERYDDSTSSFWSAMLAIILKQGIAAGIAVFLVYWITTGFARDLSTVRASLQEHIAEQRFYLYAICVNVAKDDAGRLLCQRPPMKSGMLEGQP